MLLKSFIADVLKCKAQILNPYAIVAILVISFFSHALIKTEIYQQCFNLINHYLYVYAIHMVPGFQMV